MTQTQTPETLGIIIPVYRSTKSVKCLLDQLSKTLKGVCSYHIYLIDDSDSEDISLYLKENCVTSRVTLVTLLKNYGQQAAVLCGLHLACHHPFVLTMDDDLEHPVSFIPALYQKLSEGFDLVYGVPKTADRSLFRRAGSRLRDALFSSLFFHGQKTKVSSFRIMTREIAQKTASFQGSFFYFSAVALSPDKKGHIPKTASLFYEKPSRPYGKSGYNIKKLILLFGKLTLHYTRLSVITHFFEKENIPLYQIKEPRLMVLGGSNCQLHALKRAKERSIYTILADYTKNPPAAAVADIHEPISTFDADACIEAARRHRIDGVMTLGTDQPVLTAALTAEALSLPGFLSVAKARSVTNKKIMKKRFTASGIKTANYLFLTKDGEFLDWQEKPAPFTLKPPFVLKPLDSQGQRGIFKVGTKEELFSHIEETLSFSRENMALVEEFYESDEITVSGWLHQGSLTLLTITDRLLYPDDTHIGVCIGHRFPSVHMAQYEEIKAVCDSLTEAFALEEGPFYLQLLIGEKGIFVNELACRIGGAFEDVTIPYLTGFPILDAVMDGALGLPSPALLPPDFRCDRLSKASVVLLLFCRPGEISYITPAKELKKLPGVLDCGFNYSEGSQIPVMENATARFGHAVLAGTKDTISGQVKEFYQKLQVLDTDGASMIQIFDY